MVALALAYSLLAALLIVPGWLLFRRRRHQTVWLFVLPPFAIGLWSILATFGIGPQSMGNFVELLVVSMAAILAAYLKMFLLDKFGMQKYGNLIAYMAVATVALGLRLFMPVFPE